MRNKYTTDRSFGYGTFEDSYNRRAQEKTLQYNRLAGVANTGIGAANQLSGLSADMGGAMANTAIMGANARAAGTQGQYNALGNMASSAAQLPMLYYQMGDMNSGGGISYNSPQSPQAGGVNNTGLDWRNYRL